MHGLIGEDRPDTAKRIRYRNSDEQAEAVLEFEDGGSEEIS
jgi:hypothetical protein